MVEGTTRLTPQFVLYLYLQRHFGEHLKILEGQCNLEWVRHTRAIVTCGDSRQWDLPISRYSLLSSMCQYTKKYFPWLSEIQSYVGKSKTLWENMCHVTYLTLGKSEVIVMLKITAASTVEVGWACKMFTIPWGPRTLLWLDMPTLRSSKDYRKGVAGTCIKKGEGGKGILNLLSSQA